MILTGISGPGASQDGAPDDPRSPGPNILLTRHLGRLGLLVLVAASLLGWLAAHTDVLFADGLRYIAQAQALGRGSSHDGLEKAADHPVYPLAILAVHRTLSASDDRPESWQAAAQVASVIAGILLVIPLYLVSRELFSDSSVVPACLLVYAVPLTGHVFADTLSESTFLLFWMCGLWAALRFLKRGAFGWVPVVVGFSALAYLSRPEGLLLPAALVASLVASPRWVARGLGKRGLAVVVVLVVGSACLVGPYVALRGGLGTKPSIARLLGTAPKSAAHAVERLRPLEPGQTAAKTAALAGKAVFKAVIEAVTWPLVPLAVIGLIRLRPRGGEARQWTLLAVVGAATVLALLRLHATGGYCSPRHAMVLMLIAIPAAAAGLGRVLDRLTRTVAHFPSKTAGWVVALAAIVLMNAQQTLAHVNDGLDGYQQAGRWLAVHTSPSSHVVDVTGWSQFYGQRSGYTFADLVAAPADASARWVVAREAHLKGPWEYCQRLRALVEGLEPVKVFAGAAGRRPTKVYLFDRQPRLASHEPATLGR